MTLYADAGPPVDILINNYNYDAFLPNAIESALEQDYPNVHVIVVDDGSTDASRELLHDYENTIEVVLKENGGQASAINAGLARCRGDIVMVLDADDVLKPHAASRVAAAFAEDDHVAKVQFRMEVIDAWGRPTGAIKPPLHVAMLNGDMRAAELSFPFDLPWLGGGGHAFRADALKRILPIPERAYPIRGADWYLVHLTALIGPVISIPEICASYRLHGGNGYHLKGTDLEVRYVRDTIGYARATARELARFADQLGLSRPDQILSFSELSNRLISLKLEPQLHPVPSDRISRLLPDAVHAVSRRFDLSLRSKVTFLGWFAATAAGPEPVARRLSEWFMFPERRPRFARSPTRWQP